MSVERADYLYRRKLDYLIRKREQELQDQDQADYDAYMKREENKANFLLALSTYNNIAKARLSAPTLKLQETYMEGSEALQKYEPREGGEFGPLNPLRMIPGGKDFEPKKYFEERGLKGFGEEIGKSIKKFTRPVQETEGYKQFQAGEASEISLKESRGIEVLDDEAITEADILEMEKEGFRFNPLTEQFEPIAETDPAELERLRFGLEEEKRLAAEELEANRHITKKYLRSELLDITDKYKKLLKKLKKS